jgi:hypothetical protein
VSGSTTTSSTTLSASTTLTGSVDSFGGDENRVKNVAFHIDIIASTAISATQIAMFGFPFQWDSGVNVSDPGAGRVRINNTGLAFGTSLIVSDTDRWGVNLTALYASLPVGTLISVSRVGAQANRIVATVSGSPVAGSGFYTIPITTTIGAGALANNDNMALEFSLAGPAGASGGSGTASDLFLHSACGGL